MKIDEKQKKTQRQPVEQTHIKKMIAINENSKENDFKIYTKNQSESDIVKYHCLKP